MSRMLYPLLVSLLFLSCSSTSRIRLQDVASNRTYNCGYERVLETIKTYAAARDFKVDRFETEYGTIVAHKTGASGPAIADGSGNADQVIIMKLSVIKQAAQRTAVNAEFSVGEADESRARDDDSILASSYVNFFDYLDRMLK